jgi:murein DD-endopeptidase MepM/ murein hydrolase activator NlpD
MTTDAVVPAATSVPAESPSDRPLTRREIRERERQAEEQAAAGLGAAEAEVEVEVAVAPVVPAVAAVPEEELPGTIDLTDRVIAAPAAADAPIADIAQLLTDVPTTTTSTPVQLPTRARLRSQLRDSSETVAAGALDSASETELRGATPATPLAAAQAAPSQQAAQPTLAQPTAAPRAPAQPAAAPRASARRTGRPPFVPQPSVARATATPLAERKPATAAGRVRRGAAKGVTFAAMAFVALMAVSTSLPAEALLSSADVQAAAVAARQSGSTEPAQTLDMATGTDTISVERDGYESKTIAEVAAASGIRLEATFTNNPSGTIQWPFAVGVHIGDHFGHRDCAGCSVNHQGQDFNPGMGAPIQAIADGVVSYTQDGEGSLGVHMMIDHMIDGKKVTSVYAHMIHGSMKFTTGDVVKVGQVIGNTGNTGMSTGPHLHFEIRLGGKDGTHVDPLDWLYAHVN